jgi:hypothetical protein
MPESDPTVAGPAGHETTRRGRGLECHIRYTEAEWEAIVEAARASGRTPAAFVRDASLEALPIGHSTVGNASLIRALGRCGTTLAKLATTAREIGAVPEAASLELALAELLAVVRRIETPQDTSLPR